MIEKAIYTLAAISTLAICGAIFFANIYWISIPCLCAVILITPVLCAAKGFFHEHILKITNLPILSKLI